MSYPGYPPYQGSNSPYPQQSNAGAPYPPSSAPYPTQGSVVVPSVGYNYSSPMYMPQPYPGGYPPSAGVPYPLGGPPYPPQGRDPYPSQGSSHYPGNQGHPGSHATSDYSSPHHAPKRSPTVVPANPFNPQEDAEVLRKAMKGFGTDEKAIINVLARRTNAQRMEIGAQFKTLFGKDLINDLKSELTGNFENLAVAMMTPLFQYYAKEVHDAISGVGTDETVLIEVLCSLSNAEIQCIKVAYRKTYHQNLESDLKGDTSGHFKRLMVSLCSAGRDETMVTNPQSAQADAQALLRAGELRDGSDESTFNMILGQRDHAQLRLIFEEYQRMTGHDIEKAIKNEFSGDIEDGFLAVIRSIKNQPAFFAKCLHKSMKGLGTKDRDLIRLVVTRCEVDMGDIKREYAANHGESLADAIKGDCSGDYKKCLLALIEDCNYRSPMHVPQPYPGLSPPSAGAPFPSGAPSCAPQERAPYPSQERSLYPGNQGHARSHVTSNYSSPQHGPKRSPTVVPANPFNPREDAEVLRKAMKGSGMDERAIINVLARRTNAQRMEIGVQFKTLYGKDLIDNLKSEWTGNFENLAVALMTPLPQYYAKELHDAISGVGTDESVLIEVLCSLSNAEIQCITEAYHKTYSQNLESDLKGDTSGHFKRLMVSLCSARRDEAMVTNLQSAQDDARALLRAGELRAGTDESTFNMILGQRNNAQLRLIFDEYQRMTGNDIEKAIKKEFSGDIKDGFLAVIRSIKNQPAFFAKCLHKSMKGLVTNDRDLIRLVVTRCEVDMGDIKREYAAKHGKTLADAIKADCSGHYPDCLLVLIGDHNYRSPMHLPQPSPVRYPPSAKAPNLSRGSAYSPQARAPYSSKGSSHYPGNQGHARSHATSNYSSPHHAPKRSPTVVPANPFNPREDAEVLRKAMKGFGTDEKAIINVLARRTNAQRLEIGVQFNTLYGKDLINNLKSELTGNFESLAVAMMTPLPQYYAKEVHDAISGVGTDETVLIEVLCSLSNADIRCIREAYHKTYHQNLESDLKGDTSGHFKRLMVSLCSAGRDQTMVTNPQSAQADAQALLRAGELRAGTDESTFNMILCQRNRAQLRLIFDEYQRMTGHDIEKAIKNEFSGDIEEGFLAVIRSIKNQHAFFAKCLHKSMKGLGTNDRDLIRLVVTRCEVDMGDIKRKYAANHGESLADAIKGDCSGDYKKCLLALIGES